MNDTVPVLQVEGLCFSYPQHPLFAGWSARFGAGVILVQGGESSGKTTLLRLLAGALAADGGRLALRGTVLADASGNASTAGLQVREDPFGFAQASLLPGAAGTSIRLTLTASASTASATLHNQGSTIADDLLERIFELGVSDPGLPALPGDGEHRGQGLFVARTYMAKMGGAISAHNTADGVAFTLTFQRLG